MPWLAQGGWTLPPGYPHRGRRERSSPLCLLSQRQEFVRRVHRAAQRPQAGTKVLPPKALIRAGDAKPPPLIVRRIFAPSCLPPSVPREVERGAPDFLAQETSRKLQRREIRRESPLQTTRSE